MLLKDINVQALDENKLIYNEDYYRHVFKKTEKIVAATLYLIEAVPEPKRQNKLLSDIEQIAHQVHDLTLESLASNAFRAGPGLQSLTHSYIRLTSKLLLGEAITLLPPDLVPVLNAEIEGVLRSLAKYLKPKDLTASSGRDYLIAPTPIALTSSPHQSQSRPTPSRPVNTLSKKDGSTATPEHRQSRRMQIIDVLRDKGTAPIKDIADSIADCSTKTVQRELGNLIKDNVVIRIGEKRWAKYALI